MALIYRERNVTVRVVNVNRYFKGAYALMLVIIRYIHTVFQKNAFYIQGLPDQFPKYTPSEKHAAFRILLTKSNYSIIPILLKNDEI